MPSTINADRGIVSGITGIVQTADNTGNLTLQANGVSVLTVNTSNTVAVTGLVSATGNITGSYLFGNGALLTGVITSVANINNGTSNVTVVSSGGNITAGVGGTGNVWVAASTGMYVTGLVSATGNGTFGNITATTITETSSIQFKENVRPLSNPLIAISQLAGVTYDRRDGTSKDEIGLIAEDVYQVIPELVTLDGQGHPYGIKYTKLTAYLIECIKDLQTQIDQLKKDQ